MNRRVLIISNPGEKGTDNYCAGVPIDVENYKSYFKAPYGGFWSDDEIKHLDKPTKSSVNKELSDIASFDFSIIIFCGHGWYSSVSESNILTLSKDESIDSNDLRKNAKRRIIILDSCRKVHKEYITDELRKAKMFSESVMAMVKLNGFQCKTYYNEAAEKCPEQIITAYAANINELAGDSSTFGGYYSSSLLKAAVDWVDDNIGSVDLATKYTSSIFPSHHNSSIPRVEKLSGGTQHPQIEKPRLSETNEYLPFVILA